MLRSHESTIGFILPILTPHRNSVQTCLRRCVQFIAKLFSIALGIYFSVLILSISIWILFYSIFKRACYQIRDAIQRLFSFAIGRLPSKTSYCHCIISISSCWICTFWLAKATAQRQSHLVSEMGCWREWDTRSIWISMAETENCKQN